MMVKKILLIIFGLLFLFIPLLTIKADELDDVNNLLNKLKQDLSSKEVNQQKLIEQLNGIKLRLGVLEKEILNKEKEVSDGEEALIYQKGLLNERAKSYYKNIGKDTASLINIIVSENLSESLRLFFYKKALVDEDKRAIIKIALYIKKLEEIKKTLEDEKARLAMLKTDVDKQSEILSSQIAQTRQQIAQLSARQQQLIAQKLAGLNISRSASSMGRCDSDLTNGRDPGFSPKFAFFTYGVPNRVGLNQWGAYGRAKQGQGHEQILRAYYNFDEIKSFDTNIKIKVEGYGDFSLEDYVKRIYEVPGDWPQEVLKAQAIAARSYALSYTNNGNNSICATENCQVFKAEPKGGAWDQAVNDTSGKAMVQGGSAIKAWFSSTHGGYILSSGEIGWSNASWTKHSIDTTGSINNFNDLQNNSYDKESPWFYCDWGSRAQYNKTAWLKIEEIADIFNTILLARRDSSTTEHLYQPDSPPSGADVWGFEKVKQELKNRGGTPYNSITDVSISADFTAGRTTTVVVSGDAGQNSFDGAEFKNWFNLRAPANIQIVGPLYNFEKR